jgi:hypothetical protein
MGLSIRPALFTFLVCCASVRITSGQEFAVRFEPNVTQDYINKFAFSNGFRAVQVKDRVGHATSSNFELIESH